MPFGPQSFFRVPLVKNRATNKKRELAEAEDPKDPFDQLTARIFSSTATDEDLAIGHEDIKTSFLLFFVQLGL